MNFMKNITIIFLFLHILNIQSQNYSMEHRISTSEYLSFSIDFYSDNTYIFSCVKHKSNSDVLAIHLLSFGNFEEIGELYTLRDKFNNYRLSLRKEKIVKEGRKKTILKTIDGFEWMKMNFFILSDNIPNDMFFLIENISFPIKGKELWLHDKNEQEFNFVSGIYKSHNIEYKIIFGSDRSFEIYLYNYLLSSGKWERNNNVLILRDVSLKKDFHVLIKNQNMLVSNYLPFEFRGRDFSLISNDSN